MTARKRWNQIDKLGVVVIVLALFTVGQLLYFSYTERQNAECQREASESFLEVVKDREKIFEEDRDSLDDLFTKLVSDPTEKQRERAIKRYFNRQESIERLLNTYEYPSIEDYC